MPEGGQAADPEAARAGGSAGRPDGRRRAPSLRARAIGLLATREHSVTELRRKLLPHAESESQLDALIAELGDRGYLSDARFAQSLALRRGERFGRRRIAWELDEHRVPEQVRGEVLRGLAETERARAQAAWRKRFGSPPAGLAERARQHRFLAGRGFDTETIAWVIRQAEQDGPGQD